MAVQAQYPSNVLFLQRGIQEGDNQAGNDNPFQPQPGGSGPFLDQPNLIFQNIEVGTGSNPLKRGRRVSSSTANVEVNPLMMYLQKSEIVDVTRLRIQPPNAVSTGLRLAFSVNQLRPQPQQQQQQQAHRSPRRRQQQQNHQNSVSAQSPPGFSFLSEDLSKQIKQQRDELDQFLQTQVQELQCTLARKRQRHCHELIMAAEELAAKRLREKEAEVERAARRNTELEARAAHFTAEAQAWQAEARAHETVAATLQAQLQQAVASRGCPRNDADEGGAVACAAAASDAESAFVDPERVESARPCCRACGNRVASVVLLPCRHLCVCAACDEVVQACPLCLSLRSSSIEVFLS